MEDINIVLKGIQKKIHQSPGCRYLYYYFDELVKCLKGWTKQYPNETPEELVKTIELYASECFFCCYNTPNWLMYAARSFYCADVLIEFVADEPSKCSLRETMCYYFNKLMDTDSIFLINSDIL